MVAVESAAGTSEHGQTDSDGHHVGVEVEGTRLAPLPKGQERSTPLEPTRRQK